MTETLTQRYYPPSYVPTMDDIRKVSSQLEKDSGIKITEEQIKFALGGSLDLLIVNMGGIYEIEGSISEVYGTPRKESPPKEFTHAIDVYRNARVWAIVHDYNTSEHDARVLAMTNIFNSIPINPSSGTSIIGR